MHYDIFRICVRLRRSFSQYDFGFAVRYCCGLLRVCNRFVLFCFFLYLFRIGFLLLYI